VGGAVAYSERFYPSLHRPWKLAKETRGVDAEPVGAALNRSISAEEMAAINQTETGLDSLIDRRSKQLEDENQEYHEEVAWAESTRRAEVARQEQIRQARVRFHRAQARRHKVVLASLVERHLAEAERYENMTIYLTSPVGPDAA